MSEPKPYNLDDPAEMERLSREVSGYLKVSWQSARHELNQLAKKNGRESAAFRAAEIAAEIGGRQ